MINRLKHRNIAEFIELQQSKTTYYFVFEHCSGGDLKNYLAERDRLEEQEAQVIFK